MKWYIEVSCTISLEIHLDALLVLPTNIKHNLVTEIKFLQRLFLHLISVILYCITCFYIVVLQQHLSLIELCLS